MGRPSIGCSCRKTVLWTVQQDRRGNDPKADRGSVIFGELRSSAENINRCLEYRPRDIESVFRRLKTAPMPAKMGLRHERGRDCAHALRTTCVSLSGDEYSGDCANCAADSKRSNFSI